MLLYGQCLCDVGMATNLAVSLGATASMNSVYVNSKSAPAGLYAELAIDGNSNIAFALCTGTAQSTNPWLRVDLKKEYFVSTVQATLYPGKYTSVYVFVGNNLANNGNDNHNCGKAPDASSLNWRNVSCNPPVWGRYINIERKVTSHFLQVCEVTFNYG